MSSDPAKTVEIRDALDHLAAQGYSCLLKALQLDHVYRNGGRRLSVRALSRALRISERRAGAMLRQAREAVA